MAKTRKNPNAEPEFIELAKTGLVTYHAPKFLTLEIRKYLPEIAQKADKPLSQITELWKQVDEHIQYYDTGKLPPVTDERARVDPKDIPYLQLQEHLGLAILTEDPHLVQMGASVVSFVVTARLKDLYRTNAIEYQLAVGGHIAFSISTRVLSAIAKKLREGFTLIKNAPAWVHIGIAIVLVAVLSNPRNREKLSGFIKPLLSNAEDVFSEVGKLLKEAVSPYSEAKLKSADIIANLPEGILQPIEPSQPKRPQR